MGIVLLISDLMIPLTIVVIIVYALLKRAPIYDSFIGGAMEGMKITANIFPALVGLMVAVAIVNIG